MYNTSDCVELVLNNNSNSNNENNENNRIIVIIMKIIIIMFTQFPNRGDIIEVITRGRCLQVVDLRRVVGMVVPQSFVHVHFSLWSKRISPTEDVLKFIFAVT